MNPVDSVIINLKLISKIPEHGKIHKNKDNVLVIEHNNFFTGIKRYFSSQNRRQNIQDIVSIVETAIEKNYYYLDLKSYDNIRMVSEELSRSVIGLNVLRTTTYSLDYNIVSIIELLISKIEAHVKDISEKLECCV